MSLSLLLIWASFFCDYVLMTMVIPIFPILGASDFWTGVLFASKAACQILTSPISSKLVDRHERLMIVGGLIIEALSCSVFYCTFDYSSWMAARALSGVASAAIISSGFAHLRRCYQKPEECAVAMGLATTGIVSGVVIGPVAGGALYQLDPRLPFVTVAALEVLVALVAAVTLPAAPCKTSAAESKEASTAQMLADPAIWQPLGALMLANAAISCLESTFARYGEETFGWSATQVGAMYLFVSAPSCLMSGLSGPLGNYLGDRTCLLSLGLLLQGAFTILGPKNNFWMEVCSLFGMGLGMGLVDGCVNPILGEVAAERYACTGKVFVMSNVAVQLGFVFGPVAGNAAVQADGFSMTCLVAGLALLLYAPLLQSRKASASAEPLLTSDQP